MAEAVAKANSNVALVKYWGKRNEILNLPYTGSISITLRGLSTTARMKTRDDLQSDRFALNGQPPPPKVVPRLIGYLDMLRGIAGRRTALEVELDTNFPVAAGLASSASTFAALAAAGSSALGMNVPAERLSILARRGSGSAARSIYGGFVEWLGGELGDGSDSYAVPIATEDHWRLGLAIAITDEGPKAVGSGAGMAHSVKQSPFFPAWLEGHDDDLDTVRRGILARDLTTIGEVMEHNCLKMHAVALAARPSLLYWKPATLAVMARVRELRAAGTEAYFTIDAGPQVKVVSRHADRDAVADALRGAPGVQRVLLSEPGGGVELLDPA
jgi:diphosphomevalonate decarboxylase